MLCTSVVGRIKPHSLLCLHNETVPVRSGRKMRLLGLFLLLFICEFAMPIPISETDDVIFRRVHRSAGIGETVRNWVRMLKNQIVGKWQEWFGEDSSNLSAQDILNIDKTIESRIPGYPSYFLDLSDLSFDPKQDWGIRVGKWYIIRKITGHNYDPSNDEWDPALIPRLPAFDWVPGIFEVPEDIQPPTTTSKIGLTTTGREISETVPQTEPVLSSTESTIFIAESTIASDQQIPLTTQSIATSSELTVGIVPSNESLVTNDEPVTVSIESFTESIAISTESAIASEFTTTPTESIMPSNEAIPISTTVADSLNVTSDKIITESTTMFTEEATTAATTITTITETSKFTLPIFNKRIEDNETIDRRTTKKPRPISAEVLMF